MEDCSCHKRAPCAFCESLVSEGEVNAYERGGIDELQRYRWAQEENKMRETLFVCSPETPWSAEKTVEGQQVVHRQSDCIGFQHSGPAGHLGYRCRTCLWCWIENDSVHGPEIRINHIR